MDAELRDSLKKMLVATVIVVTLFAVAGWLLKGQLTGIGQWIYAKTGFTGIFLGIFLADMFTLPLPPDLYLAVAVTANLNPFDVILVGSLASMLGGLGAYLLGRLLGRTRFAQRLVAPFRERGERFVDRLGVTAVIVAALTPIPFSVICVLAGMMGMSLWHFVPATFFRIPRIAGYFYLFKLGWAAFG